ncbi:Variant-specific surface protein, partial [Giardia duodenalis]
VHSYICHYIRKDCILKASLDEWAVVHSRGASTHRTTWRLHPPLGRCYNTRAARGSVCREARGEACVRHAEENKTDKASARVGAASTEDTCPKADNDSSQETGKCKIDKCDVTIGGSQYCSQCSEPSDHLVNGKCVDAGQDSANNCETPKTGACTSCKEGYFLYKGGCYKVDQQLGSVICAATTTAGVCTKGAEGYFAVPGATKTDQSVVACGDTTGVTVDTDKKYVGVANCAKCNAPGSLSAAGTKAAMCTECAAGFLHTPSEGVTSCIETCPKGYFGHTASDTQKKTCQSCATANTGLTPAGAGVAGCAACTYASNKVTCTKCDADKYLKTTSDSTSCVEASGCGSGFFPKADDKAGNKCAACGEAGSGGIADCQICSLFPYK